MAALSVPTAHGSPPARARLRSRPEDFRVDEQLGFAPTGAGEHVLLHICKRNTNTEWLARQIARAAGVATRDVSYAGLKDRAAVTSQWFSVHLPKGPEPDWHALAIEGVDVLEAVRHSRKLRRGALAANRFTLLLREVDGDRAELERRLETVRVRGVPNYFGEQRFGHENLARAEAMIDGSSPVRDRFQRGMYLSALRSAIFNDVLAERVRAGSWDQALPGECVVLGGTHSFFVAQDVDDDLERRIASADVHPSGPLWGRGELPSTGVAGALERGIAATRAQWCAALEAEGLEQQRRALRLVAQDFVWCWAEDDALQLEFTLEAGCYATALTRELVEVSAADMI